ncbi:hypothetical protein ACFL3T_00995 [Patescibacteria group bacterium]
MKKQEPQFVSAFIFGRDPNLNALNSHNFEREAREHADQTAAEAMERGVELEVLIIDTHRRSVETLNGSNINQFTSILDAKFPGWHMGDVNDPIDEQDVAQKILEAFGNPDYQSLSDTPSVIEFAVINFPYTYDEELKRLIEREEELLVRGSELMRYIILFNQPCEELVKYQMRVVDGEIDKAELEGGINLEGYKEKFSQAYREYSELEFHAKFNSGGDVSFKELEEAKKTYSQLVHLTLKALIEDKSQNVLLEFYRVLVNNPFLRPHKDWFTMFFQHLQQDVIAFQLDNRDWNFPIRWKLTSVVPH